MKKLLTAVVLALLACNVHAAKRSTDQQFTADELYCLTQNVYFEARNQPFQGQVAVTFVVLNRAHSKDYPSDLCDVVRQGGTKKHRCQFSWYCDGKPDDPEDAEAWRKAMLVAYTTALGYNLLSDPTKGALFYHADYVRPEWRLRLQKTTKIDRHIFYRYKAKK